MENWATHALAVAIPVGLSLIRAVGYPSSGALDSWLEGHGLDQTGPGRTVSREYLNRTRWIRIAGFTLGWLALLATANIDNSGRTAMWLFGAVFMVSVLLAELVRPTIQGTVSSTTPRDRYTYVPIFFRADALWMLGLFAVPLVVAVINDVAVGWICGSAALSGLALISTIGVQEWILRRPQRGQAIEMLRVDDAMRSMSATSVLALGYGASGILLGSAFSNIATAIPGWQGTLAAFLGGAFNLAGFAMAIGLLNLNNKWVVPRLRSRA